MNDPNIHWSRAYCTDGVYARNGDYIGSNHTGWDWYSGTTANFDVYAVQDSETRDWDADFFNSKAYLKARSVTYDGDW
ncbi:hypothetical protein QT381_06450 [Galbitalea sp. SE-J8]|uniref:hypothetical protein n=1 Tax=Galbitalea sp. SE-J8 TaxID=3054952 RepID=UPI00259CC7E9|nr:hypothetical protein [Galbitalea sp. SE-J8]MDM4762643.1 hypothetical protein [Galbitalea sp. SE-J8]